jgi:6-methylsalicylic acid synthase
VGSVSAAQAFGAWELVSRTRETNPVVMSLVPRPPGALVAPLLTELEAGGGDEDATAADESWADLPSEELAGWLSDLVVEAVAAEIRLPAADIDARRPLVDLGLDSVMTLGIRRRLERRLRQGLPATLLWNHPSVAAVVEYLTGRLAAEQIG